MKFSLVLVYLLAFFSLVGCGGGGGSSTSSPITPLPPVAVEPDEPEDEFDLVKPEFNGNTSSMVLSRANAASTLMGLTTALDTLFLLAYSDEKPHFFLYKSSASSLADGEEILCESGNAEVETDEQSMVATIDYENCESDGLIVNGKVRAFVDSLFFNIVLQLTFEDLSVGETFNTKGYIQLNSTTLVTTYQVLFEDQIGGQVYFDDFKIHLKKGNNGAEYVDYRGDVYLEREGKLVVSTVGEDDSLAPRETILKVQGSQTIMARIVPQQQMTFQFDEEVLPVTIPLDDDSDLELSQVNVAPVAVVSESNVVLSRDQQLVLNPRLSVDPNFDPLLTNWELISPLDIDVSMDVNNHILNFRTSIPGEYLIRLTVTDPHGLSHATDTIVSVSKNIPSFEIVAQTSRILNQTKYEAELNILNDALDGPFTTKLEYGPANMVLSEDNKIEWVGSLPPFGQDVEVNYAISVANSERRISQYGKVLVESSTNKSTQLNPEVQKFALSELLREQNVLLFEHEDSPGVFLADTNVIHLSGSNDQLMAEHLFINSNIDIANPSYQSISDFNQDGFPEFWLSYQDITKNKRFVGYQEYGSNDVIPFVETGSSSGRTVVQIADYNGDGLQNIVVSDEDGIRIFDFEDSLLILTSNAITTNNFEPTGLCDFNGDGISELYNGHSIFEIASGIDLYEGTESFKVVDIDSDDICETIHVVDQSIVLTQFFENKIQTAVHTLSDDWHITHFFGGNIEGTINDEILIFGSRSGVISAENTLITLLRISENLVVERVELADQLTHEQLMLFRSDATVDRLGFFDIDMDGVEEGHFNAGTSFSIVDGRINFSDSQLISADPVSIEFQRETLTAFNLSYVDIYNEMGREKLNLENVLSVVRPNEEFRFIQGVRVDDLSLFSDLQLIDSANTVYWTRELSDKRQTYVYKLSEDLIKVSNYNDLSKDTVFFINTQNGESLYSYALQFADVFSQSEKTVYPLFHVEMQGLPSNKLIRFDSTGTATVLADETTSAFLGEYHNYRFIQADADSQMELVGTKNNNEDYEYALFDPVTLTIDEFGTIPRFDSSFIDNFDVPNAYELLCLPWDKKCVNSISFRENRIIAVDKRTRAIVWRSPEFKGPINDIDFAELTTGEKRTYISFKNGELFQIQSMPN